ncbi:MAG: hypothetical protein P8J46_04515 [Alphaproteobacteria bacterium]|nr:hypothetical protein [Alphaproteobacteria bacterium]
MKIIFIFLILKYIIIASSAYAQNPIEVKTVYPPKCTLLKEKNGLLCPRIIEVEVKINSDIKKHLVRCTLFSEEEEILAFGESFLEKPGGKIYLTLRTRTRIHGLTLIAGAKCSSDSF